MSSAGSRESPEIVRPLLAVLVGQPHAGTADLGAERLRASLRFLPPLLAAERGEVEVRIAVVKFLDAPAEGGVGVEDLVADAQERADARHLRTAHVVRPRASGPRHALLRELGLGAE